MLVNDECKLGVVKVWKFVFGKFVLSLFKKGMFYVVVIMWLKLFNKIVFLVVIFVLWRWLYFSGSEFLFRSDLMGFCVEDFYLIFFR